VEAGSIIFSVFQGAQENRISTFQCNAVVVSVIRFDFLLDHGIREQGLLNIFGFSCLRSGWLALTILNVKFIVVLNLAKALCSISSCLSAPVDIPLLVLTFK